MENVSRVELLWSLIASCGIYFPTRIALGTGRTALALWRRHHTGRLTADHGTYAITLAPLLVMFIFAATVTVVMAVDLLAGVIAMLAPPGDAPGTPNTVFRYAILGSLFFNLLLKNVAVAVAYGAYKWGEQAFAAHGGQGADGAVG